MSGKEVNPTILKIDSQHLKQIYRKKQHIFAQNNGKLILQVF